MADANHQSLTNSVDISLNKNQLTTARRLVDQLYEQNNTEWYSTIIMETEDFSDPNSLNNDFLEYAGKHNPSHAKLSKYMCPIKYNTEDGFDGNGFKKLLKTLSDSSQKSGFSIIRKGYYKYRDIKYARIVCSMYEYYRGKLDNRKSSEYRVYSFHNDRKNSRGKDGKKLARKSRTGRNLGYKVK